jgi:alpha-L-fucosidase 2
MHHFKMFSSQRLLQQLAIVGIAIPFVVHSLLLPPPNSASIPLRLWSSAPGVNFNDSFVIGNGRIGGAVPGDAAVENLQMNEDSFWSGGPLDRVNPDARDCEFLR